jgi:hypothetical protein
MFACKELCLAIAFLSLFTSCMQCNEGFHGTGECACSPLYTGAECEFCKDANSFGVNCSSSKQLCVI